MNACSGRLNFKRRSGFVLLFTLVIICLAALVLTGVARRSLQLALGVSERQQQLQRDWGALSLRQALSARVEDIFAARRQQLDVGQVGLPETNRAGGQVVLGDVTVDITLEDESTKLSLNRVHTLAGQTRLYDVVTGLSQAGPLVQLRASDFGSVGYSRRAFESWGQVFDLEGAPGDIETARWLSQRTTYLTLWGTGRLNLHWTPEVVLDAALAGKVGHRSLRALCDARAELPEATLAELLEGLTLAEGESARLKSWLADQSSCFSIRLSVSDGERRTYHWTIKNRGTTADELVLSF